MSVIKNWIKAFRLRTLPLSFSNIILGTALASINNSINYTVFTLIICTTLLLQILSNLANDYGDAKKGTDNNNRIGPKRAIQSGSITLKQMQIGIIISAILSLICGLLLLYTAFNGVFNYYFIAFFTLGIGAIIAAIKYTVGKKAYGYSGMGDFFVFIFFGLVGVLGTYYLLTQNLQYNIILPAVTMGCFSTAVLNLNNMRDIDNDKAVGKKTIVVKMGLNQAKKYHYSLFFWAYLAYIIFCINNFKLPYVFYMLIPIFILGILHSLHLINVSKTKNNIDFDPELKKIALSSLLFSILIWITISIIFVN